MKNKKKFRQSNVTALQNIYGNLISANHGG